MHTKKILPEKTEAATKLTGSVVEIVTLEAGTKVYEAEVELHATAPDIPETKGTTVTTSVDSSPLPVIVRVAPKPVTVESMKPRGEKLEAVLKTRTPLK